MERIPSRHIYSMRKVSSALEKIEVQRALSEANSLAAQVEKLCQQVPDTHPLLQPIKRLIAVLTCVLPIHIEACGMQG